MLQQQDSNYAAGPCGEERECFNPDCPSTEQSKEMREGSQRWISHRKEHNEYYHKSDEYHTYSHTLSLRYTILCLLYIANKINANITTWCVRTAAGKSVRLIVSYFKVQLSRSLIAPKIFT